MRVDQIPQDDSILEGHQRACYAQDPSGRFVVATSRGWEVERVANAVAIEAVNATIEAARAEVLAGRTSVLAYHMARCHMTIRLVAAHTGLWSFQVRRHLRPEVFARLPADTLARYAKAFNVEPAALARLPE